MERTIRNSAKALIIKEGRVLAVNIKEGGEEWSGTSCLAAGRNLKNFSQMPSVGKWQRKQGLRFGELPDAVRHKDHNQTGCEWLDIQTLNHAKLYPSKLRRQIMNLYEGKPYKVYMGNEEVGDPECFE